MLLSAFNEYLEYDTVRERLLDAEASLKLHVQLAAELAERVRQLEGNDASCIGTSFLPDGAAPTALGSTMRMQDAALRLINGRGSRALKRAVLTAWRSHCDKALMLRNMRGLLPSSAAARMFPQIQDPMPPKLPPPPPAALPLPGLGPAEPAPPP